MKITFIQNLILDTLLDDDEPLEVILMTNIIDNETRAMLKHPYNQQVITTEEIRINILNLISSGLIIVLDMYGKNFSYSNDAEVTYLRIPWSVWFSLTNKGKEELMNSYTLFWKDE